ncbi:hypothetical protein ACHAXR_001313, partial [Thalassiosira sp. AJA248-18]
AGGMGGYYSDSEIMLEKQMKLFWEKTRGAGVMSLCPTTFLAFWADSRRMSIFSEKQTGFDESWIVMLYQRVEYLIGDKTLLGSEEDKIHQAKVILATIALLQQNEVADVTELLLKSRLGARNNDLEPAMKEKYPIFFKGFNATESKGTMEAHIRASGFDLDEKSASIDVIVINDEAGTREEVHTYPETHLREFISFYKSIMHTHDTTKFRLKFMGKTIFLSSSGSKTLEELGITHRSFIHATEIRPPPITAPPKKDKNQTKKHTKKTGKGKGGKQSKKKRHNTCHYENRRTLEDHKVDHSKRLSLVFEEVETTFKVIRQRLSNLSIKKSLPKDKTTAPEEKISNIKAERNPSLEGVGGKAGKTVYPILVGNAEQLYQSSKKSKQNARTLTIDLHGYTGNEATEKLDMALPTWIDTAMNGVYPFVTPVNVICGGG